MTGPIRLLVADDHPLFLDGLVATLSADADMEVVATAADASAAVRAARERRPDLALLDIAMPSGGLDAARRIGTASPETRVVMLTSSENEDDLVAAMNAGASGYVLKGIAGRELRAIVAAGLSNAEIGGRLGLAEKTVKHYMTAILGKLDVGSRVEAALLAYKAGVGPADRESPRDG
jgi:two-component system, NarL family, nitrate/nitrite response regulator NarL